ncbi:hypothetical protein ACF1GS_18095 [Streptomyces eurythermus]|uniref:hypothetical protein n=1 Tax=Streptomyces eurythermus TaxID=42237 RepID=UPI0036FC1EA3
MFLAAPGPEAVKDGSQVNGAAIAAARASGRSQALGAPRQLVPACPRCRPAIELGLVA